MSDRHHKYSGNNIPKTKNQQHGNSTQGGGGGGGGGSGKGNNTQQQHRPDEPHARQASNNANTGGSSHGNNNHGNSSHGSNTHGHGNNGGNGQRRRGSEEKSNNNNNNAHGSSNGNKNNNSHNNNHAHHHGNHNANSDHRKRDVQNPLPKAPIVPAAAPASAPELTKAPAASTQPVSVLHLSGNIDFNLLAKATRGTASNDPLSATNVNPTASATSDVIAKLANAIGGSAQATTVISTAKSSPESDAPPPPYATSPMKSEDDEEFSELMAEAWMTIDIQSQGNAAATIPPDPAPVPPARTWGEFTVREGTPLGTSNPGLSTSTSGGVSWGAPHPELLQGQHKLVESIPQQQADVRSEASTGAHRPQEMPDLRLPSPPHTPPQQAHAIELSSSLSTPHASPSHASVAPDVNAQATVQLQQTAAPQQQAQAYVLITMPDGRTGYLPVAIQGNAQPQPPQQQPQVIQAQLTQQPQPYQAQMVQMPQTQQTYYLVQQPQQPQYMPAPPPPPPPPPPPQQQSSQYRYHRGVDRSQLPLYAAAAGQHYYQQPQPQYQYQVQPQPQQQQVIYYQAQSTNGQSAPVQYAYYPQR